MGLLVQILLAVTSTGLTLTAPAQTVQTSPAQPNPVKPECVTTNVPEGITKDQAEQILGELKAIHQLLERQQTAVTQPHANPRSDQVQMTVIAGCYSLGSANAPVTVVEFADYQCPFSRKFHSETFAELKKNYIDTGKVRFVSRDPPLNFHANASGAAVAARCAGAQHKFWEMRDIILASDADLSPGSLLKYARKINLDLAVYAACLNDEQYSAAIQKDVADAGTLGIAGTPSFVVGKTAKDTINGVRVVGAVPYSVLETAIKNQLNLAPH
jgi:protein-disulfide isomerase